jgi:uncharacterized protein (DUF58 family)
LSALRNAWRMVVTGFWDRAPRQLTITLEGKILLGIALALGAAAINTGHNLLYLGWGLVLSAIVLSGILSEATLQAVRAMVSRPDVARVGQPAPIPLQVENPTRRLPAFSVEVHVPLKTPGPDGVAKAPLQLRLSSGDARALFATFTPQRRGRHEVRYLEAKTAYPFGFFEKGRRFSPPVQVGFWAVPQKVDVDEILRSLKARLGETPAGRSGIGEDFFSLRPFKTGDDPRQVAWRRSARTGRWVVRENEAVAGSSILLELRIPATTEEATFEWGLSVLGSLAEKLLEMNHRVGLRAPGILILPQMGAGQRDQLLLALARVRADDPLPPLNAQVTAARAGLVLPGQALADPNVTPVEIKPPVFPATHPAGDSA